MRVASKHVLHNGLPNTSKAMNTLSRLMIPALAAVLLPGLGFAQSTVSLYPRVGLLAPDTYFYEQFENFTTDEPTEWSTGSLGRSLFVGVGMEIELGDSGVLLRGEAGRSFDSWLRVSHSVLNPRQLFNPPYVSTAWLDVPYTMTQTSVLLVFPTRMTLWGAQPYVAVGGGGKFYEFGEPTLPNETGALLPNDGFTWGGDLGAGLTVPLFGGVTLDVQARDAITQYWEKTQHDFIYSGALLARIW